MANLPIEALAGQFRGELIEPSDKRYDEARKVYNAMIDKRPRLIARCVDVADVIAALKFGRDNGLLVAVRGGAHNGRASAPAMTAWSSIYRGCAACASIRSRKPSASSLGARKATSTTRRTRSVSPSLRGSSRRPASPA